MNSPTWAELVEAEPELAFLEDTVKAISADESGTFCANRTWVEEIKPMLNALVGFTARNADLRTSEAWETAFRRLYHQLPACRACGCF